MAAILVLFLDLLSRPCRQSQTSYCILMYLFFNYIHKRNNATVTFSSEIYEHFLKIHVVITSPRHFMYFDTCATENVSVLS